MRSQDYWKRRMEALEAGRARTSGALIAEFDRQHARALREIDKEISRWYRRFATNNAITMTEARRLLATRELMEFRWDVQDYIKFGQENAFDQRWMRELENASARVHISRLDALRLQLQQQAEAVYANQLDSLDRHLRSIYAEGYYRTAFELQRGVGVGYNLHALDARRLDRLLERAWVPDGRAFSDRVWANKQTLIGELQTHLAQSVITGQPPDEMIRRIAAEFNTSKHRAGRLVMTESAAFASMAQRDCFNDLGVEQYEIVATLDMLTSETCQELDGEVFLLRDYEVGVTAPPFHPWCRTVTAPYFDDNPSERIARGADGQAYHVPASMTYREWYNRAVTSDEPPKTLRVANSTLQEALMGDKEEGLWIPQGAEIVDVHVIAGKGVRTELRSAPMLAERYGGKAEDWQKLAGKVSSDRYEFDVHWEGNEHVGAFRHKIKSFKTRERRRRRR